MLLCCITLSSSRKTNTSSRRSKKDLWHRCRGGLRSSQDIPSTHHKLSSLVLHYFPFATCFPLPHFTLAVLFALSFPFASFSLASCFLVCWIACLSRWLKIILNYLTFPIPTIMILLALYCSSYRC